MVYSFSRLSAFEQCPYQWYLKYIEEQEPEDNWYAVNGKQVHEVLERVANKELPLEDAGSEYLELTNYNFCPLRQTTKDNVIEQCVKFFSEYSFAYINDYDVIGAEIPLRFEVGGYKFVGYIDLALRDRKDGKVIIVDYKSSAWPFKKTGGLLKNETDKFEKYKKQEYLYAEGFYQMFGEYPKELSWLFFKAQKWGRIPFKSEELKGATDWAIGVVETIEAEIDYLPNRDDYMNCSVLCPYRNSCEYKLSDDEE